MARHTMTLQELNALEQVAFVDMFGGLFEGPPWIVTLTWSARPFASVDQLYQTLCTMMYQAPVEQQVALLRAHPDLVGRAALAGTLSSASASEQSAAGLDRLSAEEIQLFQRYNQLYREQFGFPFVICAREHKKESMLAGFEARLKHTREQEIALALGEVALRLHDLVCILHITTEEGSNA